jgi:hypothetical protein
MTILTGDAADAGEAPGAATIGGVFAVATRNAESGSDLAMAAGRVIAKRVALGVAAAMNPLLADRTEFERMVPEKLEAFLAASVIMLTQSGQAGQQITRFASDAVMTATRATIAMAGCATPAALAEAQGTFAFGWMDRVAANFIAMGMLALGAQEAVMVPIRQTVAANAQRLGR